MRASIADSWLAVGQSLYLFAPLLGSAATAGVVLKGGLWSGLNVPLDGGASIRGRRVFGDNKTWRGLACSLLGSTLIVTVQKYLIGSRAGGIAILDYDGASLLALGAAFGTGAILGELPNSFVKRQCGVAPGEKGKGARGLLFYIWDQVDLLLATWPLLLIWLLPSWPLVLTSFVVVFVAHQLVSIVGYIIGARETFV